MPMEHAHLRAFSPVGVRDRRLGASCHRPSHGGCIIALHIWQRRGRQQHSSWKIRFRAAEHAQTVDLRAQPSALHAVLPTVCHYTGPHPRRWQPPVEVDETRVDFAARLAHHRLYQNLISQDHMVSQGRHTEGVESCLGCNSSEYTHRDAGCSRGPQLHIGTFVRATDQHWQEYGLCR